MMTDGSYQTKEDYELEQIEIHEERKAFLLECMETRKLMASIHPQDLKIIDQYIKLEDFTIMYDQMLERLAEEYMVDIFQGRKDDDLPF